MNISEENNKELKMMRKNFKFLRIERKWSVSELSTLSGINEKILTGIEDGEDFEIQYFIQLCRIYHVKPHEMFYSLV